MSNAVHVFYNDEGVWDDSPEFIKDPEHAFVAGKTHWWILAAEHLRNCDEVYVHRPGKIVFKATIEHGKCRRREDGRVEIAFIAPQRVGTEFHWNNQNPVRYNALSRKPFEVTKRAGASRRLGQRFRLTEETIRTAIKETGLAKLRKLGDMKELVKAIEKRNPVNAEHLALAASQVCEEYQTRMALPHAP